MEKIYINKRKGIKVYMDPNAMKNMIILKNIPSNLVDEAFIVFKDNVKIHKAEKIEKSKVSREKDNSKSKDYMIKEAEMVVQEYISRIEKKEFELGSGNKKLREKYKRLKMLTIFLGIFSLMSLIVTLIK